MKRNTKLIGGGLGILGALVAIVLGVTTIRSGLAQALYNSRTSQPNQIVLDSSNKVISAGDHVQKTAKGNDVTFTYSEVAGSTGGHVTLNANGTLINKDWIRSITSFSCVFNQVGAISAQVSYGGDVWGDSFVLNSGQVYEPGTNPYYIKFTASSTVTISSLTYNYSCVENPDAHEGEDSGDGLIGVIDFWDSSNAGNTGNSTLVNASYVQERCFDSDDISNRKAIELVSSVSASYAYQSRYGGIGLSSGNNAASLAITLNSGFEPSSVTVICGSQSPSKTLTLNSVGKSVSANCTGISALTDSYTNTLTWEFDSAPSTLTFTAVKSSKLAIYRIYLGGVAGASWDKPDSFISGFEISESVTSFNQNDVFDNANGLVVKSVKNDGTKTTLSKGDGADNYKYVVYNSNDQAIDTSVAFGNAETAIYTVVVSYKNFIPTEYTITVNYVKALTQIEVNSTNTIFNTAQKLSDFTSGISVNLKYHDATSDDNIGYSSFGNNNLTLTLLNPSLVSYSITSLFGTAGTWKIKVESTVFDVYGTLDITVNAIPVTGISVTGASATVEEESQLQLTASVVPNNATVQTVTWSSNHESIATVNTNGLVTGVSAGEARITATATDGSAVYGYIDITVTAKP